MVDGVVVQQMNRLQTAAPVQVSPGYFGAMSIPLIRGRVFTASDGPNAPLVAIVNQAMANKVWPGEDPIGHTIKMAQAAPPWVRVVGVVHDVRLTGYESSAPLTVYVPYAQAERSAYFTPHDLAIVLKTAGDPRALESSLRRAVHESDPSVPLSSVEPMESVIGSSIAQRRFTTVLLTSFAALALALAGIGVFSVVVYVVGQRTREFGLRMALGAQQAAILLNVMGQGMSMAIAGLVAGVVLSLWTNGMIRSLLVNVATYDPLTAVLVGVSLILVVACASLLPARRATSISPANALRSD
jgi:putative ABC transport system permease protein